MQKTAKLLRTIETFNRYPIEVVSGGNFGRAVCTTKNICRGEVVFCEEPLWTGERKSAVDTFGPFTNSFPQQEITLDACFKILKAKYNTNEHDEFEWPEYEFHCASSFQIDSELPNNDWIYGHLSSKFAPSDQLWRHYLTIRNRLLTNAVFDVTLGKVEWGVTVSLINHSCFPNLYFSQDQANAFIALVDIPKGSQLFRAYHIPPDPSILQKLDINCYWNKECEECLCFQGDTSLQRSQDELVEIYLMHILAYAAGGFNSHPKVWELCSEAYKDLRTIKDKTWENREEGKCLDWLMIWEVKVKRIYRKLRVKQLFPFFTS